MLRDPILSVWWTKVAIFDLSTYLPRAGCLSIELNVRNELKQGGEMLWQQVAGWNPPNWWIFEHASRVTRANCKQKHATINILGSTIYHLSYSFSHFQLSYSQLGDCSIHRNEAWFAKRCCWCCCCYCIGNLRVRNITCLNYGLRLVAPE